MKKALFLVLILFLAACTAQVPPEKQCTADADCVPATCCHPTEAVNVNYAPDCTDVFCTQVCEPGTLDCNQGEVKCVDGQCQAIIYAED